MMDGRNCTGRTISLLNNSSDVAAAYQAKTQLPGLTAHSRASSCSSTPSLSPQTPQLVRSSSSDSRGFQTPSPLTPSYGSFDQPTCHPHSAAPPHLCYLLHAAHGKMDDQHASMYPPIPDAAAALPSAYPMPPQLPVQPLQHQPQQHYRASNSPASEPSRVSTVSVTSNNKPPPKKNHYPCPMAKQVGCTDYFTTSGHAARHAKKHTGKKDAFCPECNKAFTRKDNMEQHRRTHQNGRGASRSSNPDSKIKKPTKQPAKKPTEGKAESQQLEAAIEHQLAQQQAHASQIPIQPQPQILHIPTQQPLVDQSLMMPPTGPYFVGAGIDTGPVPSLPMAMPDLAGVRPVLQRSQYTNNLEYLPPTAHMVADPDALHYSYPSPGLSNGLNSLALAASKHRRLFEEKSRSRSPLESSQESQSPSEGSP